MIIASLVTSAIGFSPVLGALIAGIVIAETEYRGEVEVITAPFRGLGLGIFLITVGMSVDFRAVLADWQSLLAALAAVLVAKAMLTALLLKLNGARNAVAAETGVLMASPSETTLVVLASAADGAIDRPRHRRILADRHRDRADGHASACQAWARSGQPIRRARNDRSNGLRRSMRLQPGQVVILGFGRVGRMVADMLDVHAKDYLAIDSDVDGVAASREEGYDVLFGDVARPELIVRLHERKPSAFILTMDNPVLVNRLARKLRRAFPDLPIVARARDTAHAAELYKAGVTDAVPETLEASLQLSEAALVDLGVAMGPVIASIHEKRDELRAQIKAEAELAEAPRRLGERRKSGS